MIAKAIVTRVVMANMLQFEHKKRVREQRGSPDRMWYQNQTRVCTKVDVASAALEATGRS